MEWGQFCSPRWAQNWGPSSFKIKQEELILHVAAWIRLGSRGLLGIYFSKHVVQCCAIDELSAHEAASGGSGSRPFPPGRPRADQAEGASAEADMGQRGSESILLIKFQLKASKLNDSNVLAEGGDK